VLPAGLYADSLWRRLSVSYLRSGRVHPSARPDGQRPWGQHANQERENTFVFALVKFLYLSPPARQRQVEDRPPG